MPSSKEAREEIEKERTKNLKSYLISKEWYISSTIFNIETWRHPKFENSFDLDGALRMQENIERKNKDKMNTKSPREEIENKKYLMSKGWYTRTSQNGVDIWLHPKLENEVDLEGALRIQAKMEKDKEKMTTKSIVTEEQYLEQNGWENTNYGWRLNLKQSGCDLNTAVEIQRGITKQLENHRETMLEKMNAKPEPKSKLKFEEWTNGVFAELIKNGEAYNIDSKFIEDCWHRGMTQYAATVCYINAKKLQPTEKVIKRVIKIDKEAWLNDYLSELTKNKKTFNSIEEARKYISWPYIHKLQDMNLSPSEAAKRYIEDHKEIWRYISAEINATEVHEDSLKKNKPEEKQSVTNDKDNKMNAEAESEETWIYKVIIELIGEGKPFKSASEAYPNVDYKFLKDCRKTGMTQYEAVRYYINAKNLRPDDKVCFSLPAERYNSIVDVAKFFIKLRQEEKNKILCPKLSDTDLCYLLSNLMGIKITFNEASNAINTALNDIEGKEDRFNSLLKKQEEAEKEFCNNTKLLSSCGSCGIYKLEYEGKTYLINDHGGIYSHHGKVQETISIDGSVAAYFGDSDNK